MSLQIKPSVTNPTIADIYQKISENRLNLSPSFQRRFVWTLEHQENFIDTILKGYPFPEIYVCQGETDASKIITKQEVIDGQQRLTTIMNYISNNFEAPLKKVKNFEDLNDIERVGFLEYNIVVRDIGRVSGDVVKEIFRRINLTKFKLDDIEIQNAIYDGQFIQVAKELTDEIDLSKYNVFYDSEITRMVDVHFFLSVITTLERGGYFTRDKEIESCVQEFNDEFPNRDIRKAQILESFKLLDELDLPLDSIWFRKSNFFTLIVEFSKISNSLINKTELKTQLLDFNKNLMMNPESRSGIYLEYYGYMYSGTNNRKSRIRRSEILDDLVLKKIS